MSEALTRRSATGILWSALETFGAQGASLIISIILARFLAPDIFGLIAMLQLFIGVSEVIAEGSLTQALVRVKERTRLHESTALGLNVSLGVVLYFVLFAAAPAVARFYGIAELRGVLRVYGLIVPLSAICQSRTAWLVASLQFKRLARITLAAIVISGGIGIALAVKGYGVWALVAQQILQWGLRALLLQLTNSGGFSLRFSRRIAGELLSFSWKLAASSLIDVIWRNIYSLVIGKVFRAGAAGLFWRAQSLGSLPPASATEVINRVAYPLLCKVSGRKRALHLFFLRILGLAAWIIFPAMLIICGLARPLFQLLFTPQWQGAAIYLQIICLGTMFYPLHSINLTLLYVAGRSDRFLRLEIIKRAISAGILAITIFIGVKAICVGIVMSSLIAYPLNSIYSRKIAGAGLMRQLRMLSPILLLSVAAGALAWSITLTGMAPWLVLLTATPLSLAFYITASIIIKLPYPGRLRRHMI